MYRALHRVQFDMECAEDVCGMQHDFLRSPAIHMRVCAIGFPDDSPDSSDIPISPRFPSSALPPFPPPATFVIRGIGVGPAISRNQTVPITRAYRASVRFTVANHVHFIKALAQLIFSFLVTRTNKIAGISVRDS